MSIQRTRMAKAIVDFEARRDKAGHLMKYELPANDGGGRYEVAGLNEKYDKEVLDKLVYLINVEHWAEAEQLAISTIASNTDGAAKLTTIPSVEFYLRDTWFNRGPTGCVRILQRAIGVTDDGRTGPKTEGRTRDAEKDPQAFLRKLRAARESYEREVVGYRANFWGGLVNRWNKALDVARTFPDSNAPAAKPEPGLLEPTPVEPKKEAKPAAPMGKVERGAGWVALTGGLGALAINFVHDHPVLAALVVGGGVIVIAIVVELLLARVHKET